NFDFARRGAELLPNLRAPNPPPLGAYPDSDINPAAVYARFVLASLLEGSRERALVEWNVLRLLYPDAEGTIAGRSGRYADELHRLIEESAGWAPRRQSPDWTTFGGNPQRDKI